ncbi:MAG: hypothetical protein RLY86_3560 [Pseudomonadota bacterium]|jgi:hypothetical protein
MAGSLLPQSQAVREPAGEEGAGGDALIQYLSVFILLLGFFILLNALSRFEETKVGQVIDSVEGAFSQGTALSGSQTDRDREAVIADTVGVVCSLGDFIIAEIPLAKVDGEGDGRTLVLSLPLSEILAPGGESLVVRQDRVALLNRIARVMQPRSGGVQVTLEALVGIAPGTEPALPSRGAAAIAQELERYEAPAAALSIGLEEGRPGTLRLLFRVVTGEGQVLITGTADGGAP